MITIPTVFVLGAGASMPYGYPSGYMLKELICKNLIEKHNVRYKELLDLGHKPSEIKHFRDALFFSGKESVDAFLEHRTKYIKIGKAAIARCLIAQEDEITMFEVGDWYQYLYDKLNAPFEEFGLNKISIITFNYDRSLEHYLFTSLKNSYGKSDECCAAILGNIPIVHLHGQLDKLPWQDNGGRKYISSATLEQAEKAASEIRIIHEDINVDEDPEFKKTHSLFKTAKRVCFLGFRYHESNVNRLRLDLGESRCFGTFYHIETAEREGIIELLKKAHRGQRRFHAPIIGDRDCNALLFLKRHLPL